MLRLLQESGLSFPSDGLSLAGEHWLHVACEHRQLELVRLYFTRPQSPSEGERLQVSCRNPRTGATPLHLCVRKRLLPLAQLLLDYGADPSLQVRPLTRRTLSSLTRFYFFSSCLYLFLPISYSL